MTADQPIGVFDSGVGGLSVLRALRAELPAESFIYYADTAHCPYGGQPAAQVVARATAITTILLAQGCKAVVVACNTATIAAIAALRSRFDVPFIGMEPGIKPACEQTRSGVVGVLATGSSLAGDKFHHLVARHAQGVRVLTQPCRGWVEAVEAGALAVPATRALIAADVQPLMDQGADVLVLGCTHFPFLIPLLRGVAGDAVRLIDTGPAVARQTRRVLDAAAVLMPTSKLGQVHWSGSGDPAAFAAQRQRLSNET